MFYKMPFILLFLIGLLLTLEGYLSQDIYACLYAISLTIKSFIILILPFIIFGLLLRAAIRLAHYATLVIIWVLITVCISNLLALLVSRSVGNLVYNLNLAIFSPVVDPTSLQPLWLFEFPKLISNKAAMVAGLILGLLAGNIRVNLVENFGERLSLKLEKLIFKFFAGFVYIIPFFVMGFVAKLQYDGSLKKILSDYALIFAIMGLAEISYIVAGYWLINKCRSKLFIANLKNMLPAAISGFTTMSSAASMPLTIIGAESNARSKDLVRSIISVTVNMHLIGDCFTIPILAYAILKNYGSTPPDLLSYLQFIIYFTLAKFSVAAIPGGGVLVMLPILSTYFKFNAEMMSMITGLYILFDPINTSINILGNGALAKLLDRFLGKKIIKA